MLNVFYSEVSPILISRFKEREETVKGDIFNVYISILQQTRPFILKSKPLNDSQTMKELEERPVASLKGQIGSIVKAIQKLLKFKNAKTRQGCFSLLTQLVNVLPGALQNHLTQIIPGVSYSLNDKNSTSNMKIDTLNFLNHLLLTHDEHLFHPYLDSIIHVINKFFFKFKMRNINFFK